MKVPNYLGAILISYLICCAPCYADGLYLGLQLGWGRVNQGQFISEHIHEAIQKVLPDSTLDLLNIAYTDTGRGGRFFVGYQFNRFISAELGYSRYSNLSFKANATAALNLFKRIKIPIGVSTDIRVNTDAFDLDLKGSLPFREYFRLYVRLGLAELNSMGTASMSFHTDYLDISLGTSPTINLIYPVIGAGLDYDISHHLSLEFSLTRIQKVNPCLYPSIDFISVGLMYRV